MKKFLFPALATLLMAAPPAMAAGPWYVLFDAQTQELRCCAPRCGRRRGADAWWALCQPGRRAFRHQYHR